MHQGFAFISYRGKDMLYDCLSPFFRKYHPYRKYLRWVFFKCAYHYYSRNILDILYLTGSKRALVYLLAIILLLYFLWVLVTD